MISDLLTLTWLLLTLFCAWCIRNRDDRLANVEAERDYLLLALADARDERDTAQQLLDQQNERVGAYLREATLLVAENERLKGSGEMDADDVIAQAEAIVAGVQP